MTADTPSSRRLFQNLQPAFSNNLAFSAFLAILLVGTLARVYGLNIQSLWFDETVTWYTSSHETLRDVVFHDRGWNMYPPGHQVFLHFWTTVFGDSETALRFPSALASSAAIVLIYLLGVRLWGLGEGLIAAGFFAVLLFPIYYAQETRPYGMLTLFVFGAALTWTYLLDLLRNGESPPWKVVIPYIVCAVLACYWHYFGLFFVGLQGLALGLAMIGRRHGLAWTIGIYAIVVILFAPWAPSMWFHWRNQGTGPANPPPEHGPFFSFFYYIEELFSRGRTNWALADWLAWIALGLIAIWAVGAVRAYWSGEDKRDLRLRIFLLAGWLLAPFLFAYFKSVVSASVYTHRNLTISMPVVYLLTARGLLLMAAPLRLWGQVATGALAVLGLFLWSIIYSGYYGVPHKDQFREAVAFVMENSAQAPDATVAGFGHHPAAFNYYLQRFDSPKRIKIWKGREGDFDEFMTQWREHGGGPVWYLFTDPYPAESFLEKLRERFVATERFTGLRVVGYLLVPKESLSS